MKTAIFEKTGGPDVLQVLERDKGKPGKGELLIRVTSAGLNRADTLFRFGAYLRTPTLPSRCGMEGAGIVEEAGEGCKFKAGDRVAVLPGMVDISAQGLEAEYSVVPESICIPSPDCVDDKDTGAIWMQYLTAWGALNYIYKVKPGDFAVITAASSSVALAAVQIVNDLGGTSIATTTSASKVDQIKANGAHHVINVKEEKYRDRIKEITGGKGIDVVFDPVAGQAVDGHIRAVKPMGTIFLYGVLDISPMNINPGLLLGKNINLRGYTLYPLLTDPAALKEAVSGISDRLNSEKFKLVIDKRFPLAEVAEAHRYMESNQQIGKIVVNP